MGPLTIALVALLAGNAGALSQELALGRRGGKSNQITVTVAALALARGGDGVSPSWLNRNLWNARGLIHENGVVELRYGSGRRSYTVAGLGAKAKFRQVGALFPRIMAEDVSGVQVSHCQRFPLSERILARLRGYRRGRGYRWAAKPPDLDLSPLDADLLDRLLRGDALDRGWILRDYPHKVALENPMGRTVYLRLDNPTRGGVRVLRLKGVMPRGGWFRRLAGFQAPVREVRANGSRPRMVVRQIAGIAGSMFESEASREFEYAAVVGGDEALGWGTYEARRRGERAGWVVYGMAGDDVRVRFDMAVNIQTHEVEPLPEPDRFFERLGADLRALHDAGVIHRAFHLGNIGVGRDGLPILRDLEDTMELDPDLDPFTRAAWKFDDVSFPLFNWSAHPGAPSHAEAFLRGYFRGEMRPGVLREVQSPDFAERLADIEAGKGAGVIPDLFPALFKNLLAIEPAWWDSGPGLDERIEVIRKTGEAV